jgi:hypothetical protein
MDKEFKVSGKEDVIGILRNIYTKMKKKCDRQGKPLLGKTKYIKCKNEFVKLSTYIKEHTKAVKDANKEGRMVKINKKISVIDNVSKIKDKKIRNLLLKTFKKNAKIYFISDNKKWHRKGGSIEFSRDTEQGVLRRKDRNSENYLYDVVDEISIQISDTYNLDTFMSNINNLYYNIQTGVSDKVFIIRPYIKYTENDKIVIHFYFTLDDSRWKDIDNNWIEMPIHITLFFSVSELQQNKYYSKHIHITSENKRLEGFGISTQNLKVKGDRTHTYLLANNIPELLEIMIQEGERIFKDWVYKASVNNDADIHLKHPNNGVWKDVRQKFKSKDLTEEEKYLIHKGIQSLDRIIFDIFYILTTKSKDVYSDIWYRCNNEPTMSLNMLLIDSSKEKYRQFYRIYQQFPNNLISFKAEKTRSIDQPIIRIIKDSSIARIANISENKQASRLSSVMNSRLPNSTIPDIRDYRIGTIRARSRSRSRDRPRVRS